MGKSPSKVCPFCGVPFAFVGKPDRKLYDWYIRKSKGWKATRLWAIDRAKDECQQCGSTGPVLHVHHLSYSRLGFELPGDLLVLCEECHEKEHE